MSGDFLYQFCMELLNAWYLLTPWKLYGYVSDLAGNVNITICLLLMLLCASTKFNDLKHNARASAFDIPLCLI